MTAIWKSPTNDNFKKGESYTMILQPMTGKRYESSKDLEGTKDTRLMFYKQIGTGYLVYDNVDQIRADFDTKDQQHLTATELKYFI